jgi:hemerythrin-like domain-containing protein
MFRHTLPKPELGGDLVRVHRAITRAVETAHHHAAIYAEAGSFGNADIREGYLTYVRCMSSLLHGHHLTEDEAMFPHLRPMLPDAPYEALTAQHEAMGPILAEIDGALEDATSLTPGQALSGLRPGLARLRELWQEHITIEEAHLGPDALDGALTTEQRVRAGRVASNHATKHQHPYALMLAFLLFNLSPHDRAVMSQMIPAVRLLLATWKPKWKVMIPFLLRVDA